ncbi:flagellar protein FlaG [Thalassospira sp.]|uniref:flagellar protein FlaG n=1 Tax=Thalassospira sp. TaxID=1912094 RepID=UPI003AA9AB95
MELNNSYTAIGQRNFGTQPSTVAPASAQTSLQDSLTAAGTASLASDNEQAAKLQQALSQLDIPELSDKNARVELNFNQDTGRVVARITDRTSGEILRELPSKELQQLFAQMREYLGSVVDEQI